MRRWRHCFLSVAIATFVLTGCGGSGPAIEDPVLDSGASGSAGVQIESLLERATHDPNEPYWFYAAATLQQETGEVDAARASLRASLDRDPFYEPAAALFAKLCFDRGEHDEAIAVLEPCAENFTASPAILTALALHYDAAARYAEADALRERLTVPGAHWVDQGASLAYLHLRSDDLAGAERTAENALIADTGSAANQNNYGIALLYRGDPKAAEEYFARAIEIDPSLPAPYYNLAIVSKYYYFDDAAGAEWFKQYEEIGDGLDPDGIAAFMNDGDSR
ncbi:MAG: tetratricopeptide repeat protein [Gemmatimonadetes bacterium]|nr:tetratricopeptide repeat protein [Gemmatimonadota bacterium]